MQQIPFIHDHWQHRMNRLMTRVEEPSLASLCEDYWSAHRQDRRNIRMKDIEFEVHTFDKGLAHRDAYLDISIFPDPFLHKFRLLSGHAGLCTALAKGSFRKVLGVVPGNLRDLGRPQIAQLCQGLVDWLESAGRAYISPFSQISDVFRNWLKGIYTGGTPAGNHPCLFAVERLLADQRSLIVATANAILASLLKNNHIDKSAEVAIHGTGLWAESVSVSLSLNGFCSHQIMDDSLDTKADVLLLVGPGVKIKKSTVASLQSHVIVEMLSDQIDPGADTLLREKNILVIPDLVALSGREMVERWLISGEGVDTWEHFLSLAMDDLLQTVIDSAAARAISTADATLILALERLNASLFAE